MSQVKVVIKEDDSVQKKIKSVAKRLQKKYNKKRTINERLIKKKTKKQKIISAIVNIFIVLLVSVVAIVTGSFVVSKIRKTAPSIAGYTVMSVMTSSMKDSGFDVYDKIISRVVDTNTIKEGDKIVFYEYKDSYKNFHHTRAKRIENSSIGEYRYGITFPELIGIMNDEKTQAAAEGSRLVFHHVYAIYEDANGERWFMTKGSSNINPDPWYINEKYVLGIYDESATSNLVLKVIDLLQSPMLLVGCIMLPFCLIAFYIVMIFVKEVQYAKLEYDIVEEKRKLDDPICLEYEIGYRMDEVSKYKVLALAPDDKKLYYIQLLWRDADTSHNSLKKYYLKKKFVLNTNEKLRDLNRECEQKFETGEDPAQIGYYYSVNKQIIEGKKSQYKKRLKSVGEMMKK